MRREGKVFATTAKHRAHQRGYYALNAEKCVASSTAWRGPNRQKYNDYMRNYMRERMLEDLKKKQPPPNMKVWRLRNNMTGLFSDAKVDVSSHRIGKVWALLGYLVTHLKLRSYNPLNWDVVEYDLVEVKRTPIGKFL